MVVYLILDLIIGWICCKSDRTEYKEFGYVLKDVHIYTHHMDSAFPTPLRVHKGISERSLYRA